MSMPTKPGILNCNTPPAPAMHWKKRFGAPLGRACGVIVGAPAAVGVLMADTALKSANVDVVAYSSPAQGTSYSNEVILIISGDSGAVRQAVISAREIGKTVLSTLGDTPKTIALPTSEFSEADL